MMKQSTSFAQVANNLLTLLQGYTKGIRFLLVMFLTLTVSVEVWGADVTLSSSTITSGKKLAYASEWTYTANNVSWSGYCYTDANSRPWIQLKKDKGVYVKIVTPSGSKITQLKVTITSSSNSSGGVTDITKHTDFSGRVALLTEDAAGSTTMTGVAYATTVSNDIATLNPSGNNNTLYLKVSGGARIWSMTVTYETAAASCTPITPSLSYTPSSLSVGGTANPTLTGNSGNGSVTYSSSNTAVATVNASTGVVTAKAAGTTTITATIAANNGYCEGTATANVTVTANPYTVTLNAGPGTCAASVTEASAGEGVTLPTPTLDGCDEWSFAGWKTTSAVTTETTTEPTLIPAGAYSPTSDITLYAVYQRTETTSGGGGGGEATAEVSIADYASANNWSDATKYTSVTIDENITATASSEGSNTGKYYTSGTNWRFYQTEEATLTLSAATGCTIKTVKVTYSVSNTGVLTYNGANVSSGTATTINATSATFGVGNTGSATNGQVRITAIEVIYTNSGGGSSSTTYYHSTPDCGSTEPTVCLIHENRYFYSLFF